MHQEVGSNLVGGSSSASLMKPWSNCQLWLQSQLSWSWRIHFHAHSPGCWQAWFLMSYWTEVLSFLSHHLDLPYRCNGSLLQPASMFRETMRKRKAKKAIDSMKINPSDVTPYNFCCILFLGVTISSQNSRGDYTKVRIPGVKKSWESGFETAYHTPLETAKLLCFLF